MSSFSDQFRFIGINLMGYGKTTSWNKQRKQTLEDQVKLLERIPNIKNECFSVVGHSFGGSVAMKAAQRFGDQVKNLVLIEPNPFYLLKAHGRQEILEDAIQLSLKIRVNYEKNWMKAVSYFAKYWNGKDSWDRLSSSQKKKFATILKPNFHEWDAVLYEKTTISEWAVSLPYKTCLITARDTVKIIIEISELFKNSCPNWNFESIDQGGHMAPVTHPNIVNPIIIRNLM